MNTQSILHYIYNLTDKTTALLPAYYTKNGTFKWIQDDSNVIRDKKPSLFWRFDIRSNHDSFNCILCIKTGCIVYNCYQLYTSRKVLCME